MDPALGPHEGRAVGHEWERGLQRLSPASSKLGLSQLQRPAPERQGPHRPLSPPTFQACSHRRTFALAVSSAWCALSRASLTPSGLPSECPPHGGLLCAPSPLLGSPPTDTLQPFHLFCLLFRYKDSVSFCPHQVPSTQGTAGCCECVNDTHSINVHWTGESVRIPTQELPPPSRSRPHACGPPVLRSLPFF